MDFDIKIGGKSHDQSTRTENPEDFGASGGCEGVYAAGAGSGGRVPFGGRGAGGWGEEPYKQFSLERSGVRVRRHGQQIRTALSGA